MGDGEGDFNPDRSSPPGDTIKDLLEEKDLSIEEFAQQIGMSDIGAEMLIGGSMPITLDLAIRLERALGPSAVFWLKRERHYRESQFGPRKRE